LIASIVVGASIMVTLGRAGELAILPAGRGLCRANARASSAALRRAAQARAHDPTGSAA
jgi:hypothetical protein